MKLNKLVKSGFIAVLIVTSIFEAAAQDVYAEGKYILHPASLYYEQDQIFKEIYEGVWAKRNGKNKSRFSFQNTAKQEKSVANKKIITYQAEKEGVNGKKTLTLDAQGLTIAYDIEIKPETGSGEIGFYIPASLILDKEHPDAQVTLYSTQKENIEEKVTKRSLMSQYKDGIMEISGKHKLYIVLSGISFKNSYGAHLQDFRDSKQNFRKNCFRYVISFNPKNGCDMNLKIRLSIDHPLALQACTPKKKVISINFKEREKLFVVNGQKINLEMTCEAPEDQTIKSNVLWRLVNESGKIMQKGNFSAEIKDNFKHPFVFDIKRNGTCRLEVDIKNDKQTVKEEILFSVFPKPLSQSPQDGILGATGIGNNQHMKDLAEICGLSWHRRHCGASDTRYKLVIKNSKLNLPYLIPGKTLEEKLKLNTLGSFFLCRDGQKRDKLDWHKDFDKWLDAWLNTYVIPLVKNTKDYIRYWEVCNEPYYEFRKFPEIYVKILEKTYQAVKEIDPGIKIVGICGPPGSIGEQWYLDTFKLGALKYMDILSFHQYCFTNRLISNPEKGFLSWFSTLRSLLKKYGKPDMPIWNSETSVTPPATMYKLPQHLKRVKYLKGHKSPDNRQQSAVMTRILTIHYAHNIKYFFHLFGANSTYTCHPSEFDGSPCAMSVAMAAANRLLEGKKSLGNIELNDRVKAYTFSDAQQRHVVVFWLQQLYPDGCAALKLPAPLQKNSVYDIFKNIIGNDVSIINISSEPVYVVFNEVMTAKKFTDLVRTSRLTMQKGIKSQTTGDFKNATVADWVGFYPINLKPYVNRSFTDDKAGDKKGGFTDEGDNDLRVLKGGDYVVNSIPFRIIDSNKNNDKSCIVLGCKIRNYFPLKIMNIKVGADKNGERLTKLHFLHMCTNAYLGRHKTLFTYVIHYADGFTEKVKTVEGKNITDWYNRKDLPEAKAVLHIPNLHTDEVSLFHHEWSISHPKGAHARIVSIDIIGGNNGPIPVIFAITGVLSN